MSNMKHIDCIRIIQLVDSYNLPILKDRLIVKNLRNYLSDKSSKITEQPDRFRPADQGAIRLS